MEKQKLVVAITGASGAVYAKVLMDKLQKLSTQLSEVGIVMSDNAKDVWKFELQNSNYENLPYKVYSQGDFFAPFALASIVSVKAICLAIG